MSYSEDIARLERQEAELWAKVQELEWIVSKSVGANRKYYEKIFRITRARHAKCVGSILFLHREKIYEEARPAMEVVPNV